MSPVGLHFAEDACLLQELGASYCFRSLVSAGQLRFGGAGTPNLFFLSRGSRYLTIEGLGLKDHDYYGFGGLSP